MTRASPASSSRRASVRAHGTLLTVVFAAIILGVGSCSMVAAQRPLSPVAVDPLGLVGVVGRFDGVSVRAEPAGVALPDLVQTRNQPAAASLLRRVGASLETVAQTSANGTIDAVCVMPRSGEAGAEVDVFVAGRFASLGSLTAANNIARYDPQTREIFPLARGLDGPVRALLCDSRRKILYVGGQFRAPVPAELPDKNPDVDPYTAWAHFGGGLAKWQNDQWAALPFKGVGGPSNTSAVNALTLGSNGTVVIVGGSFTGTADSSAFLPPNSQPVNLDSAIVSAGATSTQASHGDPRNIICNNGRIPTSERQWLTQDNAPGYWRAQFAMPATVSLIRIKNSGINDRGVKTFSVNSLPANNLITLSYFDPVAGTTVTCSDRCPLRQGGEHYQYFSVAAGDQAEERGINLNVIEWYGQGGGLASVDVFQRDVLAYADNRFNFPACAKTPVHAQSALTGDWTQLQLPTIPRTVLQHAFAPGSRPTGSVTFKPNVPEDGFYEVFLLQPGCDLDQSCTRRTSVEVTTSASPQTTPATITVDQSQRGTRRISIYTGLVAASSANFQPQVTLRVAQNARIDAAGGALLADAVQFVRLQTVSNANSVLTFSNVDDKNITWNALADRLSPGAVVHAVRTTPSGSLFLGGRFNGARTAFSNVVEYRDAQLRSLADDGVNGVVYALADLDNELLVGGEFTASANNATVLPGLASFAYEGRQWRQGRGGVGGGAVRIIDDNGAQRSRRVHVAGTFTSVAGASSGVRTDVGVYATWNTTTANWQASALLRGAVSTVVQSSASYVTEAGQDISYIGGTFSAAEAIQVSGVAGIDARTEATFSAYNMSSMSTSLRNGGAALTAGAFYKASGGSAALAVGGRFSAGNLRNLAVLEDGEWHGIGGATDIEATAMCALDHTLLVGSTSGVTTFDLRNRAQDTALNGAGGPNGAVRQIITLGEHQAVVAGTFTRAGDIDCRNVCLYDSENLKWYALGKGVDTPVTAIAANKKDLVAAGERVAAFNEDKGSWTLLGDEKALPGPATAVTLDGSIERVFVAGRARADNATYLMRWDGEEYEPFGKELAANSTVRQLSMVPLSETMSDSNMLTPKFALLVVGALSVNGLGQLDAALYDGAVWRAYMHASLGNARGDLRGLFFQIPPVPTGPKWMPVPLVILIAAAVALGLIFIIVLIALLVIYIRRRRAAAKSSAETDLNRMSAQREMALSSLGGAGLAGTGTSAVLVQPSSLPPQEATSHADDQIVEYGSTQPIGHPADITGDISFAGTGDMVASTPQHGRSLVDLTGTPPPAHADIADLSMPISFAGEEALVPPDMADALTTGALTAGALTAGAMAADGALIDDPFDTANYIVVYARYPFSATEPGELEFRSGDKVYVLDNSDDVWWMGMVDNGPGVPPSQGVFPASYVSESPPDPSPWNFF
ncbi:cortical protein marker for cell polarity-domain-containing protein [Thamnocephalis sphaerospora]|uniref:Cortical protein marker for cell polarity-domain-containing protein n=1 Tax=Thamnocephalis sphaerospora TaxID=78915 RepID=A0A4P9XX56_9FUNG|nr:cortical protein marker for cell polarity-domain-containing protein [Thamnocephalis sphaerospora]RKP10592.1 cortical protein marker for cell polarity-domain-containing protein [Thamnocephalis sphaerospora]|eukprot:RKP06790.1 cortical protein marker for cell polarity-domain-containing protein [Thamnocephalis sphaerospora]